MFPVEFPQAFAVGVVLATACYLYQNRQKKKIGSHKTTQNVISNSSEIMVSSTIPPPLSLSLQEDLLVASSTPAKESPSSKLSQILPQPCLIPPLGNVSPSLNNDCENRELGKQTASRECVKHERETCEPDDDKENQHTMILNRPDLPRKSGPQVLETKFSVRCETFPGQKVFITGSCRQLGGWNLCESLPMETDEGLYPIWEVVQKLPQSMKFEYKYFKLNRSANGEDALKLSSEIFWEQRGNRVGFVST
eukprot:Sdes_comp19823_c0_seq1m11994